MIMLKKLTKSEIDACTLQNDHFSEWYSMRNKVAGELSDAQDMMCLCGRLATGLHEGGCIKFNKKVMTETVRRLRYLL
jgi:hypothetical protein